jgi:hypothetical protein
MPEDLSLLGQEMPDPDPIELEATLGRADVRLDIPTAMIDCIPDQFLSAILSLNGSVKSPGRSAASRLRMRGPAFSGPIWISSMISSMREETGTLSTLADGWDPSASVAAPASIVAFPPGAAQRSRTRSPSCEPTTSPASCEPRLCGAHAKRSRRIRGSNQQFLGGLARVMSTT